MADKDDSRVSWSWGFTGGGREKIWGLPSVSSVQGELEQVYDMQVQDEELEDRIEYTNLPRT